MKRTIPNRALLSRVLPAALLALLILAAWELLVWLFGVPVFLLPGPSAIAGAFWESRDLLLRHAVPTVGEAVLGFLVAAVTGALSGLLINRSVLMGRSLYPWLVVSQTLPTVAIAPILVTWLGYGQLPKILVVALLCFFSITVATVDGLRATDPDLVRLMRSFGATR